MEAKASLEGSNALPGIVTLVDLSTV